MRALPASAGDATLSVWVRGPAVAAQPAPVAHAPARDTLTLGLACDGDHARCVLSVGLSAAAALMR